MRPQPTFSPSLVSSSVEREASERPTKEFKFHTFLSVCGTRLVCAGARVSGQVKQGRVSGVLLLALSACSFEVRSLPELGSCFPARPLAACSSTGSLARETTFDLDA